MEVLGLGDHARLDVHHLASQLLIRLPLLGEQVHITKHRVRVRGRVDLGRERVQPLDALLDQRRIVSDVHHPAKPYHFLQRHLDYRDALHELAKSLESLPLHTGIHKELVVPREVAAHYKGSRLARIHKAILQLNKDILRAIQTAKMRENKILHPAALLVPYVKRRTNIKHHQRETMIIQTTKADRWCLVFD